MSLYNSLIKPLAFRLQAEKAHDLGIDALRSMLSMRSARKLAKRLYSFDGDLAVERFGLKFSNPLGLAAGFDKNGKVVDQLAALGFGFIEIGTVTLKPQSGNDKPRMFRLPLDNAVINRLGFNNEGAAAAVERLAKADRQCIIGMNIGKNKDVPNEEAVENYLNVLDIVHSSADYITVNISSPNTPNLRELQRSENLDELLKTLQNRNFELGAKPLLVKIAPDLADNEIEAAADMCIKYDISGVIATNTTISREGLQTADIENIGAGGVSGKPLTKRSTEVVRKIFEYSNGKLPIIGVGGIFDAEDAFEKIAAGASLIQAYTGFIYGGPSFAYDINKGLAKILKERGFDTIDEAVGSSVKTTAK